MNFNKLVLQPSRHVQRLPTSALAKSVLQTGPTLLHWPPARRKNVSDRVPNTVHKQPFLRSVGTQNRNVNTPHRAMIRVSPTTNVGAPVNAAGVEVDAAAAAVLTMKLFTKNAIQKAPYEKKAVAAKVLPLIICERKEQGIEGGRAANG